MKGQVTRKVNNVFHMINLTISMLALKMLKLTLTRVCVYMPRMISWGSHLLVPPKKQSCSKQAYLTGEGARDATVSKKWWSWPNCGEVVVWRMLRTDDVIPIFAPLSLFSPMDFFENSSVFPNPIVPLR